MTWLLLSSAACFISPHANLEPGKGNEKMNDMQIQSQITGIHSSCMPALLKIVKKSRREIEGKCNSK
jgi:hypothetical protein